MKKYIALGVLTLVFLALAWAMDFKNWKHLDIDRIKNADAASMLLDADGRKAARLAGAGTGAALTAQEIPDMVKKAFVSAEDVRFYRHSGIDIKRIFGAAFSDIKAGSILEGGSTITQQLIKLTHLTGEKKFSRKMNEAYLALRLERHMSKDEILTAYINTVYFGEGAYGIESAANTYFSKTVGELTVAEACLLAGVIKAPSVYAPSRNMEKALSRRDYVIETMFREGYISADEKEKALNEKTELNMNRNTSEFGWYRDYALKEACELLKLSADEVLTSGFRIYTALDPERQARLDALFTDAERFPRDAADGTKAQAAAVVVSNETGAVLAVVGGREYEVQRGLNRATDARRQPGSTIKPISVYAAAVDRMNLSPTSILDDTERAFDGGYAPKNAGGSYNGLVTMREALARSLNVASVSLMEFTGVDAAIDYLNRFGMEVPSSDRGLALALGSMTYGVTPMELAGAYAAMGNGGNKVKTHAITRIEDRNGRVLYEFSAPISRAVSQASAYMITSMLETAAQTGTARALSSLPFSVAAKTGTVSIDESANRDIWTAAYNSELTICVWMGFDHTDSEHRLQASESGGKQPARLIQAFMAREQAADFQKPETVVEVSIDRAALREDHKAYIAPDYAPDALTETELFAVGNEPKDYSPSLLKPRRCAAPEKMEENGKIYLTFVIEDAENEYLLLREMDGKKETMESFSGSKGERIRYEVEREKSDQLYSLAFRNRRLSEYGISLLSAESETVWVGADNSLRRKIEELFDFG